MSNDSNHNAPEGAELHDILMVNPEGELFQFEVDKQSSSEELGRYTEQPKTHRFDAPGKRKVMSVARTYDNGKPRKRGPALSTMPVREEPGSSAMYCYLLNGDNIKFENPWTEGGWNAQRELKGLPPGGPAAPQLEVLLAGPNGKVFYVRLDCEAEGISVNNQSVSLKEVELGQEMETWSLLRNGCVAGTTEYYNHPSNEPKVLPLVNVTGLTQEQETSDTAT